MESGGWRGSQPFILLLFDGHLDFIGRACRLVNDVLLCSISPCKPLDGDAGNLTWPTGLLCRESVGLQTLCLDDHAELIQKFPGMSVRGPGMYGIGAV